MDGLKHIEDYEEVGRSVKRKKSTSKFFNTLLSCLEDKKHLHMLKYIDRDEKIFQVILMDKKNKKLWNPKYETLLNEMDSKGSQKRKKNEDSKARFRANLTKLVRSKYIEIIEKTKDSKHRCITRITYRILQRPESCVGESNATGNIRKNPSNKKNNKKKGIQSINSNEIVNAVKGSTRERKCSENSSSNDDFEKVNSHYLCQFGNPYIDSNIRFGSNQSWNDQGRTPVIEEHKNFASASVIGREMEVTTSNLSYENSVLSASVIGREIEVTTSNLSYENSVLSNIDSYIGFASNLSGNDQGMTPVIGEHKNFMSTSAIGREIEVTTSNLNYQNSVVSNGIFNYRDDQGAALTTSNSVEPKSFIILNTSMNDQGIEPIHSVEFGNSGVLSTSGNDQEKEVTTPTHIVELENSSVLSMSGNDQEKEVMMTDGIFNIRDNQGAALITSNSVELKNFIIFNTSKNDQGIEPIHSVEFGNSGVLSMSGNDQEMEVTMTDLSNENWTFQNNDDCIENLNVSSYVSTYEDESCGTHGCDPLLSSTQKQNFNMDVFPCNLFQSSAEDKEEQINAESNYLEAGLGVEFFSMSKMELVENDWKSY